LVVNLLLTTVLMSTIII